MIETINPIETNSSQKELYNHGSVDFPIACFYGNLKDNPVLWHWHDELELIFVFKGQASVYVSEKEYQIKENQGIFINAHVLHDVLARNKEDCILGSIVFHPRILGDYSTIYYKKYILPIINNQSLSSYCLINQNEKCSALLIKLIKSWQSFEKEEVGYEFYLREALSDLLLYLYQLPVFNEIHQSEKDWKRLKGMLDFMYHHYHEKISLKEIACSVSISESECLRCFKKTIQISPMKMVNQIRLEKAVYLLKQDCLIQDIAMNCGYTDCSYFIKEFKKQYGISPKQYRNRQYIQLD